VADLSQLTLFGTDVDLVSYFDASYAEAWLLTLSTSDTPGIGAASAAFLVPRHQEGAEGRGQVPVVKDLAFLCSPGRRSGRNTGQRRKS